jgi:hypothetical protein
MSMFGNAFKPGGAGRDIAGYIGDALANIGGARPVYGPAKMQERQQELELQRAMQLAQYKQQNPDPTATMQNIAATGVRPGTPEYQARLLKAVMQPHYMVLGTPESGQEVIDANNPPAAGGDIDPAAVARLKSNPHEAALFDEHFGPGSAARVLGGQ